MTVKQAASRLEVSLSLAYRLIEQKQLSHRRVGQDGRRGKIVVTEDDLRAFMEKVKVNAK